MDPSLLSKKHLKAWSRHSIQETGTPILKILAQLLVYAEADTVTVKRRVLLATVWPQLSSHVVPKAASPKEKHYMM